MGCCGGGAEDDANEKSGLVNKDEEKKEEPRVFDPDFKGPIADRSCTDIICCILFLAAIGGLVVVAIIGFVNGDPRRIVYPTNSKGQICGKEVEGREKLLYFDLLACAKLGPAAIMMGCPTPQVCVSKCPTKAWFWVSAAARDKMERYRKGSQAKTAARADMVCLDSKTGNDKPFLKKSITDLVQDNECAPYTYPSVSMMGRCMPELVATLASETMTDANNRTISNDQMGQGSKVMAQFMQVYGVAQTILEDLGKSWHFILIGCLLAMLLSLFWIFLLRLVAGIMVLITMILFLAIFAVACAFCYVKYAELKKQTVKPEAKFTPSISYYFQMEETWLVLGIISSIVFVLLVIVLIFLRDRIRMAVELIKEASRCVGHMMTALFWPLIPFILQMMVLAFCLVLGIYLQSIGTPVGRLVGNYSEAQNSSANGTVYPACDPKMSYPAGKECQFVRYESPKLLWALQLVNVFMFFWLFNFVIALGQMTLAGAFASYYWAFVKPDQVPSTPILSSVWRCLRYHLGTLAFGSLIIAIVQMIRVALEYIDSKLKGSENVVAKFLVKCMKCCFWCLEQFVRFLTKNAYIMTAIYGYNFCTAAKNAFFLILRNLARVCVIDKVADLLIFIGKLVVVGLVGSLSFFFFNGTLASESEFVSKHSDSDTKVTYFFVPVTVIVLASYFIASLFFSVYSMAVDTLFLCFLEDLERNDGSAERPYYMNKSLMEVLGKKNDPSVEKKPACEAEAEAAPEAESEAAPEAEPEAEAAAE